MSVSRKDRRVVVHPTTPYTNMFSPIPCLRICFRRQDIRIGFGLLQAFGPVWRSFFWPLQCLHLGSLCILMPRGLCLLLR